MASPKTSNGSPAIFGLQLATLLSSHRAHFTPEDNAIFKSYIVTSPSFICFAAANDSKVTIGRLRKDEFDITELLMEFGFRADIAEGEVGEAGGAGLKGMKTRDGKLVLPILKEKVYSKLERVWKAEGAGLELVAGGRSGPAANTRGGEKETDMVHTAEYAANALNAINAINAINVVGIGSGDLVQDGSRGGISVVEKVGNVVRSTNHQVNPAMDHGTTPAFTLPQLLASIRRLKAKRAENAKLKEEAETHVLASIAQGGRGSE